MSFRQRQYVERLKLIEVAKDKLLSGLLVFIDSVSKIHCEFGATCFRGAPRSQREIHRKGMDRAYETAEPGTVSESSNSPARETEPI
jgi:hypothetical protein